MSLPLPAQRKGSGIGSGSSGRTSFEQTNNDIWTLFWSSTRSANDGHEEEAIDEPAMPLPPPEHGAATQTLVLFQPNSEREKQRVARSMRLAGFDRSEYDMLPTIDMKRVVELSCSPSHSNYLHSTSQVVGRACLAECDILQKMLSNTALFALQRGRESPYDVDTLQAVGEYLTHVAAWRHAVRYRLSHLVVISGSKFASRYDNASHRIKQLLREAPDSYDLLLLGVQRALVSDSIGMGTAATAAAAAVATDEKVPGTSSMIRYGPSAPVFQDMSAYVVSLQGARKLLERALPIETRIAPYIGMSAQIDCSMFALLAQPPVADVSSAARGRREGGEKGMSKVGLQALEDLSMQVPRRFLAFALAGMAILSLILLVTTIVFAVKWWQANSKNNNGNSKNNKVRSVKDIARRKRFSVENK